MTSLYPATTARRILVCARYESPQSSARSSEAIVDRQREYGFSALPALRLATLSLLLIGIFVSKPGVHVAIVLLLGALLLYGITFLDNPIAN